MDYRLPTLGDKAELDELLREFSESGENDVLLCQDLFTEDYPAWVELIAKNATLGSADWGRSQLLLCREDGHIAGILCIRHELPDDLEAIYGTIGYSVRPSRRRRGYATKMLRHALDVCKGFGLESATLGCFKDNLASIGVIRNCGGILVAENENYVAGRRSLYFKIPLA